MTTTITDSCPLVASPPAAPRKRVAENRSTVFPRAVAVRATGEMWHDAEVFAIKTSEDGPELAAMLMADADRFRPSHLTTKNYRAAIGCGHRLAPSIWHAAFPGARLSTVCG